MADVDALDFTDRFNTKLSPDEEKQFQDWAAQNGKTKDLYDYDMRGAWKSGTKQAGNGHYPDTFKKPNHPTFSDGSMYSTGDSKGGKWVEENGKVQFKPSAQNLKMHGAEKLQRYFQEVEPDVELVLPKSKAQQLYPTAN